MVQNKGNFMKRLWIILLILPILLGCAESRKFTLKMSQEDLKNAANSRKIADNMMSRWSLNSGAIRCGMGGAFEESRLAPIVIKYDKAVMDAGKWVQEDFDRGCVLGLEAKLGVKSMEEIVSRIMELVAQYGGMF